MFSTSHAFFEAEESLNWRIFGKESKMKSIRQGGIADIENSVQEIETEIQEATVKGTVQVQKSKSLYNLASELYNLTLRKESS